MMGVLTIKCYNLVSTINFPIKNVEAFFGLAKTFWFTWMEDWLKFIDPDSNYVLNHDLIFALQKTLLCLCKRNATNYQEFHFLKW